MSPLSGLSLRSTLIAVFSVSVAVPSLLVMAVMPVAYNSMITAERRGLTDAVGQLVNGYLDDYLDAMERETIIPYFSPEFAKALRERGSAASGTDQLARKRSDELMMRVMQNAMWVYRDDIVSSVLVATDGRAFAVSRKWGASYVPAGYRPTDQAWYQEAVAADGRAVFVAPHAQDYLAEPTVPLVFSVARLIRDPDTQSPLGVIMVDQNTRGIERVLGELDLGIESIMVIADKTGTPLYVTRLIPPGVAEAMARGPLSGTAAGWLAVEVANERFGWRVAILLSQAELARRATSVVLVGALFLLGSLAAGLGAFALLSRRVTAPVSRIAAALAQVEAGALDTRIVPEGVREARELGAAFNAMAARIERLIDEEYRAKLNLKEAEFQALQAQLQPHFLYNVLYCLQGLNRLGERDSLEAAIYDLHDMLRYSLEPGAWTTVGQELAFLRHYCVLQKLRFQERLEFSIDADAEAALVRIPRLVLQPLVENAIIHGIEPLSRPCTLRVEAALATADGRTTLVCRVSDDGQGFDPDAPHPSGRTNGHGLGLGLVRERLGHAHPDARFTIASAPGHGTAITLEIPL